MAYLGQTFFDGKNQAYAKPDDATKADLAAILGKLGDGESLAPGIATVMLERRAEIEKVYAEHDEMISLINAANIINDINANITKNDVS